MLNYTKRYVNLLAFFMTLFVLVIFMILDIIKLQEHQKHQKEIEIQNSINIENVYTDISKQYQKDITEEEVEKIAKENIEKEKQKQREKQEIEKITSINIYSTNPWRIKIPKFKIDAPIAEGTSQESMRRTVGHFEQTDRWNGNVALAGHNRGYRCNFFQEIKKLEKGDIIIYSTEKGKREYKVVLNKVIKETDWSYIENTKDNRITLITCEINKKEYRRCIQAIEVKDI